MCSQTDNWKVIGSQDSSFCREMDLEARVQGIEKPEVGVEVEIKEFALKG